ncbi:MAG: deoxynucleoside kinase [Ardenticatenales bacterium]|nr:deoxynucleoside kinase [Ardenticatenales bacterium]
MYIAIEGVIGVGKTSLATLLQDEYNAQAVMEVFEENPFLSSFYHEPERYAFQVQVAFLLSRYQQQRVIGEQAGRRSLVSDYLFAKDQLFARLNLSGDEWETYHQLYHVMAERIIRPDLVVYLRASTDTLMERITRRGRPYEKNMARQYIERLAATYEAFFATYNPSPLLIIDSDGLDFVGCQGDLRYVRQQLDAALGRVQVVIS